MSDVSQSLTDIIDCVKRQLTAAGQHNNSQVLGQPQEMIFFHGYLTAYVTGRMERIVDYSIDADLTLAKDLELVCESIIPHRLWTHYCCAQSMVSLKHVATSDVGGINEQGQRAGTLDSRKAPLLANRLYAYLTASKN